MKRVAAPLFALVLALLALALLSSSDEDEAVAPRPAPRVAAVAAPTSALAALPPAPVVAPTIDAPAPSSTTPPPDPAAAPLAGDLSIERLVARLRAGARDTQVANDGPLTRGPAAPGAPTAWLLGHDGRPVPVYNPQERALLDDEARTVSERRGTLVGTLEQVGREGLSGFAYDYDDPAAVLEVDLFVDGFLVETVRADVAREALGSAAWSARRGFKVGALPALAGDEAHVVQAFARRPGDATGKELVGSPERVGGNRPPEGVLVDTRDGELQGYASDPDGSVPVRVVARLDGRALPPVLADLPRLAGFDEGPAHGWFRIALPAADDDAPHVVQVLLEDAQVPGLLREAGDSPKAVGHASDNATPQGAVTFVNPTQLSGWALDPDVGDAPISVDVHVDGVFWRRLVADREFAALVHQPGITSPYHLWLIDVPPELQDGRTHTVSVFAVNQPEGADPELSGSPTTFKSVANTAPTGWVDVADVNVIGGWAYDADRGAAPVEVEVWIDGALWQVLVADGNRPDLVPVVCPEAAHGWSVAAPEALRDGGFHIVRVLARNHPGGPAQELAGSPRELGGLRCYLGVGVASAPGGLRVDYVAEGSPAAQVGVQVGDVVVGVNDEPAPLDPEPFARWIQARVPGEAITLVLERPELAPAPPARHTVFPVLAERGS
jgi:hypothetical protein